jgi:hypothetical protein
MFPHFSPRQFFLGRFAGKETKPLSEYTQDSDASPADAVSVQIQESGKVPNEILDLIFAEVPVEYRCTLRRVSRGRKDFIDTIGYQVKPTHVQLMIYGPPGNIYNAFSTPIYPDHIHILPNPVLLPYSDRVSARSPGHSTRDYNITHYPTFKPIRLQSEAKLLPHQTEFVTSPPITTMSIGWT